MTIVNQAAGHGDLAHLAIDLVGWSDQVFFDRRRISNNFESRSRFINILKCAISTIIICVLGGLIRIESGRISQRQHFTRLRIHNDRGAGFRVSAFDRGE